MLWGCLHLLGSLVELRDPFAVAQVPASVDSLHHGDAVIMLG